jgi:hypothetical protein
VKAAEKICKSGNKKADQLLTNVMMKMTATCLLEFRIVEDYHQKPPLKTHRQSPNNQRKPKGKVTWFLYENVTQHYMQVCFLEHQLKDKMTL